MNKRIYYPLTPTRGVWRQAYTVFMDIQTDERGAFVCASSIQDNNMEVYLDALSLVEWISNLKSGVWVVIYSNDFIGSIFQALIDHFTLSAYGENAQVIDLKRDKKTIHIVSIFSFFGKPLYKIVEKSGMNPRAIMPHNRYTAPVEEYTQNTAILTMAVWHKLALTTGKLFGIYPSKTPGATAIKSWRTTMTEPIFAKGKYLRGLNQSSVSSGGVHWKSGHYREAYKYDINACYPFVMSMLRYPVSLSGFTNCLPYTDRWIATVRLNYKSNHAFSPLSARLDNNNIVHPDNATNLRVTLTYIDYQVLSLTGEVEITQWIEGVYWRPEDERDLFGAWVKIIQDEIENDPTSKPVMKIFTRALHSKFAQKPKTDIIEIRRITNKELFSLEINDVYILPDGSLAAQILTPVEDKFQAYINPEYEALTQAGAKLLVYSMIDENTIYIDTDSIISTVPRPDLSIGDKFGQWKLEGYGECYISGPRSYAIENNVKSSGVRPVDYNQLHNAVMDAALGNKAELLAIENSSLSDPMRQRRVRTHTIQKIKYPYTETRGGRAFVTASPTVEYPIRFIKRLFSKLEAQDDTNNTA